MARGDNPNSRANLKKGKPFNAETARKAQEKSLEAKVLNKKLNDDLRERCTPERMARLNDKLLHMAERGNLKAYELVRDGLGEKPIDKHAVATIDKSSEAYNEYLSRTDTEDL